MEDRPRSLLHVLALLPLRRACCTLQSAHAAWGTGCMGGAFWFKF